MRPQSPAGVATPASRCANTMAPASAAASEPVLDHPLVRPHVAGVDNERQHGEDRNEAAREDDDGLARLVALPSVGGNWSAKAKKQAPHPKTLSIVLWDVVVMLMDGNIWPMTGVSGDSE